MVETMSDNELRPAARNLLDVARTARTPSDQRRERAYQALVAGLGGTAAVGTAKVAVAAGKVAAQGTFAWFKWALPAALAVSGGIGAYVWSMPEPAAPSSPAPVRAPAEVEAPTAAPAQPLEAPVAADSRSAQPEAEIKLAAPSPKPSAKPAGDALVQELSLLHEALAASRSGNAARALELAREHAQRYPASRLGIERSAIEVRSLCSLGRPAEARKVADRLRARAPSSPVSAALKDTCVGK